MCIVQILISCSFLRRHIEKRCKLTFKVFNSCPKVNLTFCCICHSKNPPTTILSRPIMFLECEWWTEGSLSAFYSPKFSCSIVLGTLLIIVEITTRTMNNFPLSTHFKLIIQVRVNGNERWKCKYHKINRVNVDFYSLFGLGAFLKNKIKIMREKFRTICSVDGTHKRERDDI